MGQPHASLSAASTLVIAGSSGISLPANPDFNTLRAYGAPFSSVRITETGPAALAPKETGADMGTRVRIRYTNVPQGTRIYVPDFLAGSTAPVPTSGGDMDLPASAGAIVPGSTGILVMARVKGTTPDGADGNTETFSGQFGAMSTAEVVGVSEQMAVYEVLDASGVQLETVQVPAYYLFPLGWPPLIIRTAVSYAPLSTEVGGSATAPIPRFEAGHPVALDCGNYPDCEAPWAPRMEVLSDAPLNLTLPKGSGPASSYLLIRNLGRSVLEWQVGVSYEQGSGWLTPEPSRGFNNATVSLQISARNLELGAYRAWVTVASATSPKQTRFQVTLTVVTPLPPPVVAPRILGVVSATHRGSSLFAPGMLAAVLGMNFRPSAVVRVAGAEARLLWITDNEIVCVMPADLKPGPAGVVVVDGERVSNSYTVIVAAAAPAIAGVLNENGLRNSETNPAKAGTVLQMYGGGVPPGGSLVARIHDIWIEEPLFAGPAPGFEGLVQMNFRIPELMPTMMTEVQLCTAPLRGDPLMCSLGYRIWVLKRDEE
jgi:uncharacterized protein (TIGR03437 family)